LPGAIRLPGLQDSAAKSILHRDGAWLLAPLFVRFAHSDKSILNSKGIAAS
jgi:hypothetical protein